THRPPRSTLFPYTTLFRSQDPWCPLRQLREASTEEHRQRRHKHRVARTAQVTPAQQREATGQEQALNEEERGRHGGLSVRDDVGSSLPVETGGALSAQAATSSRRFPAWVFPSPPGRGGRSEGREPTNTWTRDKALAAAPSQYRNVDPAGAFKQRQHPALSSSPHPLGRGHESLNPCRPRPASC